MAVVVAEYETPHPYALVGRGNGGQRGQRSKLVAEWLLDEMVAEQKRGEACLLGPTSRLHQLLGRADALPQESESKRVRMHHPLCHRASRSESPGEHAETRSRPKVRCDAGREWHSAPSDRCSQ